jgi:hypothetical protein
MREALLKYAWGLLQDRGGLILCLRRLRRDAGSARNRRLAEVVKVESAHLTTLSQVG